MSSRTFARARFGAAVAIAFASGLVFASGFDLTRFGYAQSRTAASCKAVGSGSQIDRRRQQRLRVHRRARHAGGRVDSGRARRARYARQRTPRRNAPPGLEDFFQQFDPRTAAAAGSQRLRIHRLEGRLHPHEQSRRRELRSRERDADRPPGVQGEGRRPRSRHRRRRDQDRRERIFRRRRSGTTRPRASASGCSRSATRSASTSPSPRASSAPRDAAALTCAGSVAATTRSPTSFRPTPRSTRATPVVRS